MDTNKYEVGSYPVSGKLSGETINGIYLFGIIIVVVIIALMIGLFIGYQAIGTYRPPDNLNKPQIEVINPKNIKEPGASKNGIYSLNNGSSYQDSFTCNTASNRQFWNGICNCNIPFWSPDCSRESYDIKYTASGNPTPQDIELSRHIIKEADMISFEFMPNDSVCTKMCDSTDGCIGVYKKDKTCILILDDFKVKPGENIRYDPLIDSTLYLKNGIAPSFQDRVFPYRGTLPNRYWTEPNGNSEKYQYTTIFEDDIMKLEFTPTKIVRTNDLIGIWSNRPFTQDDIQNILDNPGKNIYIHESDAKFKLPFHASTGLWATYVSTC